MRSDVLPPTRQGSSLVPPCRTDSGRNQTAALDEASLAMPERAEPTTETPPARTGLPAGQRQRIDRYELRERIGRGRMGSVYRAIDTKLGRTVALKTVAGGRGDGRLTDGVRQLFLREALALSRVEHRNVVQILDFGFADDGAPFLVMEYLRGRDLGALLDESDRPPGVAYVVDIMLGVCAALRACHRVGIVHRDLKPGNIFLAETDTGAEVKVLDFGVSNLPAADEPTWEGQVVGTPQYLAPEQVDGKVGPASDQYALGVLICGCLTSRLPHEGHREHGRLRAIDAGQLEPSRVFRPDLPQALESIVLRAMRVSPGERFESVYALGQRLWELASPRGQAEWKSYYFPPAPARCRAQLAEVSKTQILEGSRGADPPAIHGAPLALSTKLARPRSDLGAVARADPGGPLRGTTHPIMRRLRRAVRVLPTAVVAMILGSGARGHLRHGRTPPSMRAAPVPTLVRTIAVTPMVVRPTVVTPTVVRVASPMSPSGCPVEAEPPGTLSPDHADAHRRATRAFVRRPALFRPALPNIDRNGVGIPTD
jgi:hypothetical protein